MPTKHPIEFCVWLRKHFNIFYLSIHVGHPVVGELDPVEGDGCLGVPELSSGRAGVVREDVLLLQGWVTTPSYHPLRTTNSQDQLDITNMLYITTSP